MKRLVYIFVILAISILAIMAVFSCKQATVEPLCDAPNVSLVGRTISWNEVSGAKGYRVRCFLTEHDSYTVLVNDTSFDVSQTIPGDYRYLIASVDANGKSSEFSSELVFHVGTGTRADPILVSTVEDLKAITSGLKTDAKGANVLDENKETIPLFYLQTNDIDLGGIEWAPIGKVSGSKYLFSGIYNGYGYTIKNYKQTKTGTGDWTGFFAEINKGSVINLNLSNARINITKASSAQDVGGLCGALTAGTLENCHVDVDISFQVQNNLSKLLSIGGLVGKMQSSSVSRCSSSGSINAKYGRVYAGGLIGYVNASNSSDTIVNCHSKVDVVSLACHTTVTTPPTAHAAALIGFLQTAKKMSNCYATGTLSATLPSGTETPQTKQGKGLIGSTYGSSNVTSNIYRSYVDVVSCYVDKETTLCEYPLGIMRTPTNNSSVYALTTSEMKTQQTYVDWDFENVWQIKEGEYPTLREYKVEFPAN